MQTGEGEMMVLDQQATRERGETALRDFTPRMGAGYAKGRNFDRGPGAHRDVSQLSPFIRRRLVLERDAVAAALAAHGYEAAEKFVQEVIWRGYFKGWLEHRPQVWNITRFTAQRFTPRPEDLAEDVHGLEGQEPEGLPDVMPLHEARAPDPKLPTALLITEEDCRPEDFDLDGFDIRATATLSASHLRSPRKVSGDVAGFEAGALADAARRMRAEATALRAGVPGDLATWAARAGAAQIVTPYVPTGPLRDWLNEAETALDAQGIPLCEMRRDWDAAIWPHATAGFFKVKKKIPQILHQTGLS
jgi:hypothetical protein